MPFWIEMRSVFCMQVFSAKDRRAHPVNTWRRQSSLGSIQKRLRCQPDGTAKVELLFELQTTNTSITAQSLVTTRSSGQSDSTQTHELQHHSISQLQHQTSRRQRPPTRSWLCWTGKCKLIYRTALTSQPPTIPCSCPWVTSCNTRPSSTKMTWISGRTALLPPSPKPFIVITLKVFPKNGRKWWTVPDYFDWTNLLYLIDVWISWNVLEIGKISNKLNTIRTGKEKKKVKIVEYSNIYCTYRTIINVPFHFNSLAHD